MSFTSVALPAAVLLFSLMLIWPLGSSGQAASPPGGASRPASAPAPSSVPASNPVVVIETSMGTIKVELWADKAPVTAANFLTYADEKFYDGLIFHRVIKGFMIQCGGYTPDGKRKAVHEPIKNEAGPELKNERGTLAMARTGQVDSATSQFFINLANNGPRGLDQRSRKPDEFGYCVFGKVVEGMDVVDKIAQVKCKANEMGETASPVEPVLMKSVRRAQ